MARDPKRVRPVGRNVLPPAFVVLICAGLACLSCTGPSSEAPERLAEVREAIRSPLEEAEELQPEDPQQRRAWEATVTFYRERDFQPFWVDGSGPLARTDELLTWLRRGEVHGLPAEDYDFLRLAALRAVAEHEIAAGLDNAPSRLADVDLVYTHTFLTHAIHLIRGRVVPVALGAEWYLEPRSADPVWTLLESGGEVAAVLERLVPQGPQYERLLEVRRRFQELVDRGGWPEVPEDLEVERGSEGPGVAKLRARLAAGGDLEPAEGNVFDPATLEALKRFQVRHGLEPDGELGSQTREALRVPASERLRTLEVNLERWRWLGGDFEDPYVAVNIPDYHLWIQRGEKRPLEMRVIVGKRLNKTPVFSDRMTYLVLNPSWYVPASIAKEELLPTIREDPSYARRQGFEITRISDEESVPVDPTDLEPPGPEAPRYRLRQLPGPKNSLGRIKFMFPNEHNIYLHDTPADSLFSRTHRGFSHGCVRVEKPIELAAYLLDDKEGWSRERIESVLAKGGTRQVELPEPIPVHFMYWTSWVDEGGVVHFRKDLYGHDDRLAEELQAQPRVSLDLKRIHRLRGESTVPESIEPSKKTKNPAS